MRKLKWKHRKLVCFSLAVWPNGRHCLLSPLALVARSTCQPFQLAPSQFVSTSAKAMPRRGGGGGARAAPRRSAAPSRSFSSSPPPPAPHAAPPPPAQRSSGGGMLSGLGGMMAQGMALGTGSGLAHAAIDGIFSSKHPEPQQVQQAAQQIAAAPQGEPCQAQAKTFMDCLSSNNGDMDQCRFYFDTLQSCKLDAPSTY